MEWPNITSKKDALPEADNFRDEKGKFEKYFIPEPGDRRLIFPKAG